MKLNNIILLIVIFLASYIVNCEIISRAPSIYRNFGSNGNEYPAGSVVTSEGNIIVAGTTDGSLTDELNAIEFPSAGGTDIFLTSYSKAGYQQWVFQTGGPGNDRVESISITEDDKIYLVGSFTSTFEEGISTSSQAGLVLSFTISDTTVIEDDVRGVTGDIDLRCQSSAIVSNATAIHVACGSPGANAPILNLFSLNDLSVSVNEYPFTSSGSGRADTYGSALLSTNTTSYIVNGGTTVDSVVGSVSNGGRDGWMLTSEISDDSENATLVDVATFGTASEDSIFSVAVKDETMAFGCGLTFGNFDSNVEHDTADLMVFAVDPLDLSSGTKWRAQNTSNADRTDQLFDCIYYEKLDLLVGVGSTFGLWPDAVSEEDGTEHCLVTVYDAQDGRLRDWFQVGTDSDAACGLESVIDLGNGNLVLTGWSEAILLSGANWTNAGLHQGGSDIFIAVVQIGDIEELNLVLIAAILILFGCSCLLINFIFQFFFEENQRGHELLPTSAAAADAKSKAS